MPEGQSRQPWEYLPWTEANDGWAQANGTLTSLNGLTLEVERLKKENEQLKYENRGLQGDVMDSDHNELVELRTQVSQLRKYACHLPHCVALGLLIRGKDVPLDAKTCSCGLRKVFRRR